MRTIWNFPMVALDRSPRIPTDGILKGVSCSDKDPGRVHDVALNADNTPSRKEKNGIGQAGRTGHF
jgi:hypothetical protein